MTAETLRTRTVLVLLCLVFTVLLGGFVISAQQADAHGGCGSSSFCGHIDPNWLSGLRSENGDDPTWVDDGFNDVASSASNHETMDVRLYRNIDFTGSYWCTQSNFSYPSLTSFINLASSVDYDSGGCVEGFHP